MAHNYLGVPPRELAPTCRGKEVVLRGGGGCVLEPKGHACGKGTRWEVANVVVRGHLPVEPRASGPKVNTERLKGA